MSLLLKVASALAFIALCSRAQSLPDVSSRTAEAFPVS